jgi:phosphohistidine phosphatase
MKLYLVRHGEAVNEAIDPARPLSAAGRAEAEKVARMLKRAGVSVRDVHQSGKKRAEETAGIMAAAVSPGRGAFGASGLSPNDEVEPFKDELADREEDLMIVGHLPHLARLASLLLTGGPEEMAVNLPSAGVICLERDEDGLWGLNWMVVPELLE